MIVALVHVGDKYPKKYVDYMETAISRNTKHRYTLEIIRHSARPGWWAKTELFRPRKERVLYFDLDTVILGSLDPLFEYDGPFAIIKDWWASSHNSSVMSIAPGFGQRIWRDWSPVIVSQFYGDQNWITAVAPAADYWQDVAPGLIGSYKADNLQDSPKDYKVICFHGEPKPHQIEKGWVHEAWV
jgi:hypothetical protein